MDAKMVSPPVLYDWSQFYRQLIARVKQYISRHSSLPANQLSTRTVVCFGQWSLKLPCHGAFNIPSGTYTSCGSFCAWMVGDMSVGAGSACFVSDKWTLMGDHISGQWLVFKGCHIMWPRWISKSSSSRWIALRSSSATTRIADCPETASYSSRQWRKQGMRSRETKTTSGRGSLLCLVKPAALAANVRPMRL